MPYIVNFTDSENKTPITVFDNTSSQDTSLTFPGRNVTGYGQIIAENFLSLLENFESCDNSCSLTKPKKQRYKKRQNSYFNDNTYILVIIFLLFICSYIKQK
mgnify:CR=1 FL=1